MTFCDACGQQASTHTPKPAGEVPSGNRANRTQELRRAGIMALLTALLAVAACWAGPVASQFDDAAAPFVPGRHPGEAEADRSAALAHFAAGRTLHHRGSFALAMRHYARADRLDPAATHARSALIAYAVEEKRFDLAARFAVKGFDPAEVGDDALRRLAVYFTEQGDAAHAIECYEKSLAGITARNAAADNRASEVLTRMELGRLYHVADQFGKAAEQFSQVLDALDHPERYGITPRARKILLGDDSGPLYVMFGEAFLLSDRPAEAEAAFRKANSQAPSAVLLEFNLARVAARRGRAQEALAGLEAYLELGRTTEGAVPYQLLADLLKRLGRESELLDRLKKLLQAQPDNVPLRYFLAGRYLKAGKPELAEPLYAALAEKTPTMSVYRNLAEIYRTGNRPDRLLALLGRVVSVSGALETLGPEAKPLAADERLFKSLIDAGRTLARSATGRNESSAFFALGILAQERKEFATANEFFELALKADGSKAAEILLAWGVGSLIEDRAAEAVSVFRRGLDMQAVPADNPVFDYYLAGALAAADKFDAALESARRAVKKKPDSARFASRVPWILQRARRHDEALAAYAALIARFGGDAHSREAQEVLRMARVASSAICAGQNRLDEAERWLEEVLDEYPDDVGANNDLGYLWADRNVKLQRALKMILAAVAAEPDNRAYRDSLGWIFFRLGRLTEAAAELEKAIDPKQPDGTVLDHLGDVCRELGKTDKARDAWRQAVEAYQKDKEPEKAAKVREKLAKLP